MTVCKQEFDEHENNNQQNAKRSRITFDVCPELRRRIKVAAAEHNKSIGAYLGQIIEQAIPAEMKEIEQLRQPVTQKSSNRLRSLREQTLADRNGRPFDDATEMIRQMRNERTQYSELSSTIVSTKNDIIPQ